MIKFSEKVKFVAMDKDGKFKWFSLIPDLYEDEDLGAWAPSIDDYDNAYIPSIIDMSDYVCEDWTESLYINQNGTLVSVSPDTVFEPEELILVKATGPDDPWTPARFIKYDDDTGVVSVNLGGNSGDIGTTRYRKFDKDLLCRV